MRHESHTQAAGDKTPTAAPAGPIPALLTLELIRRLFLPLSRRHLQRMLSAGEFPRADVAMGQRIRLWRRETVEQWIDDNATAS